jgi:hypothetical protein
MRLTHRATCLMTLATAGLLPLATAAAASASSAGGTVQGAGHCLAVTAMIPVGDLPFGIAVNPK